MPEDQRVHGLEKILVAEEGPAILAWIVEGAREHNRKNGHFDTPEAVDAATTEYAEEEDAFGQFIADRCTKGNGVRIKTTELRAAYDNWCNENGIKETLTPQAFGRRMKIGGFEVQKSNSVDYYAGIMIKPSPDQAAVGNWMDK